MVCERKVYQPMCVCKEGKGKEREGKRERECVREIQHYHRKYDKVFLFNFITELKMDCYVTMHMSVGMGY